MAAIVHIETSTNVCSVALSADGQCLFHKSEGGSEERKAHPASTGPNHARVLAPMIEEAVKCADERGLKLDAVAVSSGPGSYTGLRIGVSMAKGLCYGRSLELVSVKTLELLCVPVLLGDEVVSENALLCPMLDARRMEVYTAIYDRSLHCRREVMPVVVNENSFADVLAEGPVLFFGNGAEKCKAVIRHPNAVFVDGVEPMAKNMMPLAEKAFLRGQTEDVAYFEPFYLKEFVAGVSKKMF